VVRIQDIGFEENPDNPNISYVVTARGGDVAQKSNAGQGERRVRPEC
jgi:hypothetical protein